MNRTRAGCGQADTQFAGKFAVTHRRERRRLLVSALNETDFILPFPEGFHDSVDAVSREAEYDVYTGVDQMFDKDFSASFTHKDRVTWFRFNRSSSLSLSSEQSGRSPFRITVQTRTLATTVR